MSNMIEGYRTSLPVALPVKPPPAEIPPPKPKTEEAGSPPAPSAGEEILSTGPLPINYYYGNSQVFELLRSFIEQKFRIIEEIRNAMRPTPEELAEQEELEAQEEMEELEQMAQEAQDEVEAILQQLDDLMAWMATPTQDMAGRMAMVSGELRAIIGKLSKLGLEVGRAISHLNQQDTSGMATGSVENLVSKLVRLDEAISSIIDACSETADQAAAA